MIDTLELACPATALFDRADTQYPNIAAALRELDVNVLLEDGNAFLLGWVGVSSDGRIAEIVASPPFDSLNQLEVFCTTNASRYKEVGRCINSTCAYPAPLDWWWRGVFGPGRVTAI